MEKILIIDDEQDVHYSFTRLFASKERGDGEPLSVLTAASGEEGLRVIAKENPDVVIMDVRMGGILPVPNAVLSAPNKQSMLSTL